MRRSYSEYINDTASIENNCNENNRHKDDCKIDKAGNKITINNNIKCGNCNGAQGPQGATGSTGSTGATGATTQIRGMQVQLKNPDIVSIAPGAPIIFDTTISPLSPFISYNNITGEITIIQNGVFYINWWVSTNGFGGGADVVITMAIITSAGDNIQASNSFLSGQINGNALISVTASPVLPVILRLVNVTDGTLGYGSTPIKADLTIVNVTL